MPRVSVIMSVYNAEMYVREAINSVLLQTFSDFEFIIVNDGSTDGCKDIIEGIAKKDKRINLINRENKGLPASLNKAASMAKGEYLARMDADDVCLPRRFEIQVSYLDKNPEIAVVGGKAVYCDQDLYPIFTPNLPPSHLEIDENLIKGTCVIVHPTTMIRKKVLDEVGGYDETFMSAQDLDLWLRIGDEHSLENIQETVLMYRIVETSTSGKKREDQSRQTRRACQNAWNRRNLDARIVDDADWRPGKDRSSLRLFWLKWGWQAWNAGNQKTARRFFFKSLKKFPMSAEVWRAVLFGAFCRKK